MKNLQFILILLLFSGAMTTGYSQTEGRLSGTIHDEKGMAIPYATISVLDAENFSFVTGTITEESGGFLIQVPSEGSYVLRISSIGFEENTTAPFKVTGPAYSKDFGVIVLKEEITSLYEITITSQRPLISVETDRIVVRVEGTVQAAGNTAFDVISKSPGIWVDQNGNIQLNGKSGAQVMIDGRLTYLSARDLQTMLRGMSAENIKNIEIISNPSAKFDAEGDAGIININLTRKVNMGLNGSIYTGSEFNGLHSYSAGANLNYKTGPWNFYTSIDAANRLYRRTGDFNRIFNSAGGSTIFDQEVNEKVTNSAPSIRLGTDLETGHSQSLGAVVNLSWQEVTHELQTNSFLRTGDAGEDLLIDAGNHLKRELENGAVNLHYTADLDTIGSSFSADVDLVRINNREDARYVNQYDSIASNRADFTTVLSSENPTQYDIFSTKADYSRSFSNGRKLEVGAKFSHLISDNDLRFFFHEEGSRIIDPNRSNHFIYEENIYAAYGNLSTKWGEKINLQAGLRLEQTIADGISLTLNEGMNRRYLDLFPSLFVQHKVSDNYRINYSYSRRIQRPDYELLNPFKFYLDPYSWAQGNPLLKPSYTNAFGIIQTFKKLNFSLNYSITQDFIAEVPVQNIEDNTTIFFRENVDDSQNLSATLMAPMRIMKTWESTNRATLGRQYFSMDLDGQQVENEQVFYMFQSTQNLVLPKDYRIEMNTAFVGPQAWGLYQSEAQWWIDLGVKKSFLNDKIDLTLSLNDIFRSRILEANSNRDGNINEFRQYRSNQSIGFNLRYRFNKGQIVEVQERDTSLEEMERTGRN